MILGDLLETLKNPHPTLPLPQTGTELNTAIHCLENILNTSVEPHQPHAPIPAPKQAPTVATTTARIPVPPAPITATKTETPAPSTTAPILAPQRSPTPAPLPTAPIAPTISYPNRTIIRKKFKDKFHEGEITGYDSIKNFYKIKYRDGDIEEFTPDKVTEHQKELQCYSRGHPQRQLQPLVETATNNKTNENAPQRSPQQQIQYSAGYSRDIVHIAALLNTTLIDSID